jgi:inositol 3-alpha-galactosyltransferase
MLLLQNMDDLLEDPLPEGWAAAVHTCVCNWTRDAWAADDWRPWTCALTHAQVHDGAPPQPAACGVRPPHTHALMNSGLVVLSPSPALGAAMEAFVRESPLVPKFAFPDQDALDEFFAGHWKALSWNVNAIKTARYWHPRLWRDAGVRNLHYIVDKPWAVRKEQWAADDIITHGVSLCPSQESSDLVLMRSQTVVVGPLLHVEGGVQARRQGGHRHRVRAVDV